MTDLERLRRLMRPPPKRGEPVEGEAWSAAETALGVALPTDYRAFVAAYGPGDIDGFLRILGPGAVPEHLRLVDANERQLGLLRWLRDQGTEVPPIFPEAGGVLLCAETVNGDCIYWMTEPRHDPSAWRIMVNEARGPEWLDHEGPFTEFLADVLERRIHPAFFPVAFPSASPQFAAAEP